MAETDIRAVILAAGTGTRLLPMTREAPKSLVEIHGKTILERIVLNCREINIEEYLVVVGHGKEAVRKTAADLENRYGVRINLVENTGYRSTNTGVSLRLALEEAAGDVLIINGDNVFEHELLAGLAGRSGTAVIIDNEKELVGESFKVRLADRRIAAMGKDIPIITASGEFIGISLLRAADLADFRAILDNLVSRDRQAYYDFAFQVLSESRPVSFVFTGGRRWTEVDTMDDLQEARRIIAVFESGLPD